MTEKILAMIDKEAQLALELSKAGKFRESFVHEQQARRLLRFIQMENFIGRD